MAPTTRVTYADLELFCLRVMDAAAPKGLRDRPDISDMVRLKAEKPANARATVTKRKDESDSSTEVVLFKGRNARRMAPASVPEPVHRPVHQPVQQPVQKAVRSSTSDSTADTQQPPEWNLHSRSDSDVAKLEPTPAPSGIPAQKAEGFQRFRQEYVSPASDRRVTAGGRIVPVNNRGHPSPTPRRARNVQVNNSQGAGDRTQANINGSVTDGQPNPSFAPQYFHGYPPGMVPLQTPMSFMPVALGPQLPPGFAFGQTMLNGDVPQQTRFGNKAPDRNNAHGRYSSLSHAMVQPPSSKQAVGSLATTCQAPNLSLPSRTQETLTPLSTGVQKDSNDSRAHGDSGSQEPEKIKISPPEMFDAMKPFTFNGQILYPMFAPGQNGGQVMQGYVGFPVGPEVGLMMPQASHGMGINMGLMPTGMGPAGPTGPAGPAATLAPNGRVLPAPIAPVSSIRPSEITKKQITTFKANLKYLVDQLTYNKHQIDEAEMRQRIQVCEDNIRKFETMLDMQLQQEKLLFPKSEQETSLATGPGERPVPAHQRHTLKEIVNRSSLPSEAALAPPFMPRGFSSSSGEHSEPLKKDEGRQKYGWKPAHAVRGSSEQASQSQDTDDDGRLFAATGWDKSVKAVEPSREAPSETVSRQSLGVPYLLGVLPKGVNPRTAKDQDYVYHRELTEDESRARYLHWGRAPKSALQGLPKYDGKHFYPPSPIMGQPRVPSPPVARRVPVARGTADSAQSKSEADPFRPVTPVTGTKHVHKLVMASEDECAAVTSVRANDLHIPTKTMLMDRTSLRTRENSSDASLISQDRRSEKHGPTLLQIMLKKVSATSAVSSVTSTMAQGYLPHYAGNAAASLIPSTNRNTSPTKAGSMANTDVEGGAMLLNPMAHSRENLRPDGTFSLEEGFKNMTM